jgi:shikimate dehydrogenase
MSISITNFLASELTNRPFFVLIGEKTDYSHSPLIHNTALKFHSINASYYALNVSENEISSLEYLFAHQNFLGANVTIPYKRLVMSHLATLDEVAERVGAVNVIKKEAEGSLSGYNTDVYGFLRPMKIKHITPPKRAVILGSGGASAAVVEGLRSMGTYKIYMVSRNPENVNHNDAVAVISYSDLNIMHPIDAVINATPVGMGNLIDQSPVSAETLRHLNPDLVYDLIYKPQTTKFLRLADSLDISHIFGGLLMLVYQAAKAFQIWTDKPFPEELVLESLKAKLSE